MNDQSKLDLELLTSVSDYLKKCENNQSIELINKPEQKKAKPEPVYEPGVCCSIDLDSIDLDDKDNPLDFGLLKISFDKYWVELLSESDLKSFPHVLLWYIDQTGLTDAQIYRQAGISRQHFSNIKNVPGYKPSRTTVLALIIALQLTIEEATKFYNLAGFAFSRFDKTDMIVKYCVEHKIYNFDKINMLLEHFGEPIFKR